jgi:uncharacterized membrane protein
MRLWLAGLRLLNEENKEMKWWIRFLLLVPCHRIPERCLKVKGEPLPICARCMSILLGYLFIPLLLFFSFPLPWYLGVTLQVPMFVDGFTQLWKWRESTNALRVVTGLLSGLGLSILVVWGARMLVRLV